MFKILVYLQFPTKLLGPGAQTQGLGRCKIKQKTLVGLLTRDPERETRQLSTLAETAEMSFAHIDYGISNGRTDLYCITALITLSSQQCSAVF